MARRAGIITRACSEISPLLYFEAMKIKSVLIAGAGAIGLSTAESIYKTDPACISILAKGERLERYQKNGLKVNGKKLDFRFSHGAEADLILIASKFHHLNQIIEDIRPSVGKDTIILSLLNGISSEEIINAALERAQGRERLPLAIVLGTDAFHKGEETGYSQLGCIHFGDADGKNGAREESLVEFFTRTGVKFKLEENMKRVLWYKFMVNVGLNQVSAVLGLPYGAFQKKGENSGIPEARQLLEKTMLEVIAVANAEGIDLNEGDIETWYKSTASLSPNGYCSMCQDVMAKRKTEVEMFSLTLMELAKKHSIAVPANEFLYLQLKTIERISLGSFF